MIRVSCITDTPAADWQRTAYARIVAESGVELVSSGQRSELAVDLRTRRTPAEESGEQSRWELAFETGGRFDPEAVAKQARNGATVIPVVLRELVPRL